MDASRGNVRDRPKATWQRTVKVDTRQPGGEQLGQIQGNLAENS
jgi:hypothetical protein